MMAEGLLTDIEGRQYLINKLLDEKHKLYYKNIYSQLPIKKKEQSSKNIFYLNYEII